MIDLSDIVSSDDLGAEALLCSRVVETISARGRAVDTEQPDEPFVGIVTMDKGAILERLPDGAYVTGSILVTTSFSLSDGDIVKRGGSRYTAKTSGDYARYGFVYAVCVPDGVTGAA